MMWWNGEPLPIPSPGISFEERIVEGTNSGQTLSLIHISEPTRPY